MIETKRNVGISRVLRSKTEKRDEDGEEMDRLGGRQRSLKKGLLPSMQLGPVIWLDLLHFSGNWRDFYGVSFPNVGVLFAEMIELLFC